MNVKALKKLLSVALTISIVSGISGCGLISKTPEGEMKTAVAKVNGQTITKGEFLKKFEARKAQMSNLYGADFFEKKENETYVVQIKQELIDSMVSEALLLKRAEELKVVPDEKTIQDEVNKRIEETKKSVGGEDKLNEALKNLKLTLDDYKEQVRKAVIINKLYENITKDIKVTDDEIKKYYDENKYDYTEKPNTMNVSHILVKTKEEADKVKKELDGGAKFEDLAKKYSQDPGSKDKGGNLGDIAYNDKNYDKTFMAAAIATPDGKISEPIQTQFGYHIIKINKKQEYKQLPIEKVKSEIENKLLSEKKDKAFQDEIKNLREKAKIKIYTDRL